RPRRHRLHALAVGVSEKAASVARESASSPPIAQEAPNPLQVRMQALFGVGVQRCNERRGLGGGGVERVHAPVGSRRGSGSKVSAKFRRSSAKKIQTDLKRHLIGTRTAGAVYQDFTLRA